LFEDRAPLWREKPGTPRAISDLVARMMAKERADRPADAAAVLAELAALGDVCEEGDLGSGERMRPSLPALGATLPDDAGELDRALVTSTAEPAAPAIEALRALAGRESMQVLGIDDDHIIGNAWNVSMLVWGKRTTLHAIAASERAILAHAARFPEGIGLLTVVEEISEIPNDEERKALSVLLGSLSGKLKRSAVAHEGTGFRAAAVRGVATGLTLLARIPFPHRTFEGMEPAVTWLMEGLPERPVEAPVVLAAAREMRRLFDAHRARRLTR
jgi:hypothetical protein